MKRFIRAVLSLTVLIAVAIDGYWLFLKQKVVGATSSQVATSNTASSNTASSATSKAASTSTSSASSTYQDGTYTGAATSTQWGDVQVQATVAGGKLTKVTVLEYPDSNGHDQQINATALPVYKQEAVTAQSANIQLVSGASETYKGFTGSLQDALDQAKEGDTNAAN